MMKLIWTVVRHKWYVLMAGLSIGEIPFFQLLIHDWSKFSFTELAGYYDRHVLGRATQRWNVAWEHHKRLNRHHHQYWVGTDGNPLEMPERYAREMVADWVAAGKDYGSPFKQWVADNLPSLPLHPSTRMLVEHLVEQIT